jgi:hypothetical protein
MLCKSSNCTSLNLSLLKCACLVAGLLKINLSVSFAVGHFVLSKEFSHLWDKILIKNHNIHLCGHCLNGIGCIFISP